MTATTVRARDTPGRTATPQQIDGLLVIDTVEVRARYECYRPGCQRPLEEPIKPSAIGAFIDGIKTRHLAQYHGSTP